LLVNNPSGSTQNIATVTLNGNTCRYTGSSSTSPSSGSVSSMSTNAPGVTGTTSSSGPVAIAGGTIAYLVYKCDGSYTPGVSYDGTIYLESGTSIPFTVVAQAIS
ncbi:MAG: hypothetical protein ACP5HY_09140, partial [Caldivirga sp.]